MSRSRRASAEARARPAPLLAAASGLVAADLEQADRGRGAPSPRISSPRAGRDAPGSWLADPQACLRVDLALLVLGAITLAVCLTGTHSPARLLLVLACACLLPGTALLTRLGAAGLLQALALAIGLGLCLESIGTLAMIWSGHWHPLGWALLLLGASSLALTLDLRRNARPPGALAPGAWPRPHIPRAVLGYAPAALALSLWALSLRSIPETGLGDYGLPPALPASWYVALAVAVLGAVGAACAQPEARGALAGTYVALSALILFGTVPAISAQPHYAWVYKHIGVVRYLEAHGQANPAVDIYNRWPGFFAFAAAISTLAGRVNPASYAGWADLFFVLLDCLLLAALVRALTASTRVAAAAALLFVLTDWVGQTYYSPQAFAFAFALALALVALTQLMPAGAPMQQRIARVLSRLSRVSQRPPLATAHWPRAAAIAAVLALDAVIVASHQLTPYMLLCATAALLAAGVLRPVWMLAAMAAMTFGYLAANLGFIEHNYGLFTSVDPFNNVQGAKVTQHPSAGKSLNTDVELLFIALVWGSTLLSICRLARRGLALRALPFVLLALTPLAIVFGQNYGGEASLRTILFSGPWCAALIAWAIFTLPSRRLACAALTCTAALFTPLFVVSYLGQEELNIISPAEERASEWFYAHARRGSVLVLAAPGFPYRYGSDYPSFAGPEGDANPNLMSEEAFQGQPLGPSKVPLIAQRIHQYSSTGYIAFTRAERTYAEVFRITPPGAMLTLRAAVAASTHFRLAYRNPEVQIYELLAPVRTLTGSPAPERLGLPEAALAAARYRHIRDLHARRSVRRITTTRASSPQSRRRRR